MTKIILSAVNTKYSQKALALPCLKSYWDANIPYELNSKSFSLEIIQFDLNQSIDDMLAALILEKPDIIAFSTYIWSLKRILEVCGALKQINKEIKIILGGPEVSYSSEEIMINNTSIDIIVRGEGEITFHQLISGMLLNQNLKNIEGITWRDGNSIVFNPDRPLIENLDILPFPYSNEDKVSKSNFLNYEASRGCAFRCKYCQSSVTGKVRNFTLHRVKRDLDYFLNSSFKQIRFIDRTFNIEPLRALQILQYIIDNNHRNISFHFEIKAELLTDEMIKLFSQAPTGMFHLEAGIQSTNANALFHAERSCNIESMIENLSRIKNETNCTLHVDILGGLEYDTYKSFQNSVDNAFNIDPHEIQISMVKVLRGTQMELSLKENMISAMPDPPYKVLKTKWLSPEEVIIISRMGRFVDSTFNLGRFRLSFRLMSILLFENSMSNLLEALINFWSERSIPFYGLGPERMYSHLQNFARSHNCKTAECLLEHEMHLLQRTPKVLPQTLIPREKGKTRNEFRLSPGVHIFWYRQNINEILSFFESPRDKSTEEIIDELSFQQDYPWPVIYRYQHDLSVAPSTQYIDLNFKWSFVLSCLQYKLSKMESIKWWNELCLENTDLEYDMIITKLLKSNLIYS